MAIYKIKAGESLELRYKIKGKSDLSGWVGTVLVKQALPDVNPAIEVDLDVSGNQFTGVLAAADTQIPPRMYWLVCIMRNADQTVKEEVHDKLIIEERAVIT